MNFSKTEVWGFEHAIRGMRQPLQSHSKSDSCSCGKQSCDRCSQDINNGFDCTLSSDYTDFAIGKNDLELAQKLIKSGSEHRKFLRQIFVSVDITAPLYWWKEESTYKIGTTENSTSTMHKLASTPITIDCFEIDDFEEVGINSLSHYINTTKDWWDCVIAVLEDLRQNYNRTKDKRYWKELIRLLPESWLQTRTVTMNYENLLNMYHQRKNHKLSEWHKFCHWIESLPYAKELIVGV